MSPKKFVKIGQFKLKNWQDEESENKPSDKDSKTSLELSEMKRIFV
jgi:hypothetical protein